MASEAAILRHAEEIEFFRELARQAVVDFLAKADLEEMTKNPDRFVEEFLAAVLIATGATVDSIVEQTKRLIGDLNLADVGSGEINQQVDESKTKFIDAARPVLISLLLSADRRIQKMIDDGVAPEVIAKGLQTEATQNALLAGFESAAKSSVAGYLNDIERSIIDLAVQALARSAADSETKIIFGWIAVMDGKTCDDVFENSCAPRHNEEKTLSSWDDVGRPGSPNLLCSIFAAARGVSSYCRCILTPAGLSIEPILTPINVGSALAAGRGRAIALKSGR